MKKISLQRLKKSPNIVTLEFDQRSINRNIGFSTKCHKCSDKLSSLIEYTEHGSVYQNCVRCGKPFRAISISLN